MSAAGVGAIRSGLLLDDTNSRLMSSESPDSYHTYFRPSYNGRPPTIDLLQAVLGPYAKAKGIEIYPQRNRAFRLPFGKGQNCLDMPYIEGWENQFYWLEKMDDFDLSTVKSHQTFFDFTPADQGILPGADLLSTVDVPALLANGLPGPSTRDWAQFELVRHVWRQNVAQEDAWRFIWDWIRKKHNGFSKDYLKHPQMVRDHIRHQVSKYYFHMLHLFALPDRPHASHNGYICKPDILKIVQVCAGSLPRMRFVFELVKFMNPRQRRDSVPIHSDQLAKWSGRRTYRRHMEELESKGVLKREKWYSPGEVSKTVKLNWPYKSDREAVLWGGRAVETLEEAVKMIFKPAEFRGLLEGYVKRTTTLMAVKTLFESVKKGKTIIHDSPSLPPS
jgi:hypothetical protein